jgi:hypothetical protein
LTPLFQGLLLNDYHRDELKKVSEALVEAENNYKEVGKGGKNIFGDYLG